MKNYENKGHRTYQGGICGSKHLPTSYFQTSEAGDFTDVVKKSSSLVKRIKRYTAHTG